MQLPLLLHGWGGRVQGVITANKTTTMSGFHMHVESNSHLLCITTRSIGFKNSRHFLHQSEVKPKPVVAPSQMFFFPHCIGAGCFFCVFNGLLLSVLFVIVEKNIFSFGSSFLYDYFRQIPRPNSLMKAIHANITILMFSYTLHNTISERMSPTALNLTY